MYKTQQSYDEMNDDFIQFDSDMSHVDDEELFSLAERITVPEPHIINEMWQDDEKYNWRDIAKCLRDNWHEIKDLVSWDDRDKMSDFAFDNHFEWVNMINQMLDALQSKSARVIFSNNTYEISFSSYAGNSVTAYMNFNTKKLYIHIFDSKKEQYIKEADLMAMIYYINEYGE